MSRKPSLTYAEAVQAEIWFREYERVGTFTAKARELHVHPLTLRDAIKRVRGFDTRPLRKKLSILEIDQLATELMGGTANVSCETNQTGEQQSEDTDTA